MAAFDSTQRTHGIFSQDGVRQQIAAGACLPHFASDSNAAQTRYRIFKNWDESVSSMGNEMWFNLC
jgi:hypothetical protein